MSRTRFLKDYIAPREVTMTATMTPEATRWIDEFVAASARTIRITLSDGAEWPKAVKRGQSINLTFHVLGLSHHVAGKVRFKRKNVAVIDGTMTSIR